LSWLAVEHVEALRLVAWLERNPAARQDAEGMVWIEALEAVETRRAQAGINVDNDLLQLVRAALEHSGVAGAADPWGIPRTGVEAGLRPLLMATRSTVVRRGGA
jgi:hypothetical protein